MLGAKLVLRRPQAPTTTVIEPPTLPSSPSSGVISRSTCPTVRNPRHGAVQFELTWRHLGHAKQRFGWGAIEYTDLLDSNVNDARSRRAPPLGCCETGAIVRNSCQSSSPCSAHEGVQPISEATRGYHAWPASPEIHTRGQRLCVLWNKQCAISSIGARERFLSRVVDHIINTCIVAAMCAWFLKCATS